jgi:hypothetical protein
LHPIFLSQKKHILRIVLKPAHKLTLYDHSMSHFFMKCLFLLCSLCFFNAKAQLFINEGSNRNYSSLVDEDGDYPDWVELYNAGPDTVFLLDYALSDDPAVPMKWVMPNIYLLPGEFKTIFCSGKDRKPVTGFTNVLSETNYNAVVGWSNHQLTTPFYWDGVSSILLNICSYSGAGYTTNSVFNQSLTPNYSTIFTFQDGSPFICEAQYGNRVPLRPNLKLNNTILGTGTEQNSPYDYPAPYGNWYWAAKNQMILPASELLAAGLSAGNIDSLGFDVVSTDPNTIYDYINFAMKLVAYDEVTTTFETVDTLLRLHTNFKIASAGETVYLYSPSQILLSSLSVNCAQPDNSIGLLPDASANTALFLTGTPAASNNASTGFSNYLLPPVLSAASGLFGSPFSVSITNPNPLGSIVRYTLNGDDPDSSAAIYNGNPIQIFYSAVLKAKAFSTGELPSTTAVSSYLLGINHVTPVLSVVTDQQNLYGPTGIFDNWQFDWERAAYVEYFDTAQQLIFSQNAGIQVDGGAGGSRSHPQHSFRVELDHSVLGEGPINYPLIPNRPGRTKFSKFYLRNGSNYYLSLPYKDAAHTEGMAAETNNYYSAWRPISVYINGAYFGLYELREKFDAEYFEEIDNSDSDSLDLLSLSYWNGSVLRALEGSVDSFYTDYASFNSLNPADTSYWNDADNYFDMVAYNDYIIAETWAGNIDWPYNNIKLYRSNASDFRWRFCLIDLEGSMNPFGFSTAYDDHINYVLGANPANPFINVFLKGIQNARFKNYFINRYADLMNTSYLFSRLSNVENSMFNQTVVEMPKEYMRWGDPNNINGQMNDFNNNHQTFLGELSVRTSQVRNHIQNNFALNNQVDVTLDVFPANAGKIKISTIIPDALPWTGVYFDGNPVKITAIPNPGYEFAYWDTNAVLSSIDTNISLVQNITANSLFRALFTTTNVFGNIAITEINYNSDSTINAGNWVEFHNFGNAPLDIAAWRFTDSTITNNYYFPAGTVMQPGEYLVLVEDTALFHSQFPALNVYGPTGFGFSNTQEALTLFDLNNLPVISVHYYDSLPWPIAADGFGRTLELLNDTLDASLATSWFPGCIGGSPGGPYVPCTESLIFSEINYKSSPTANAGDWVEILNVSPSTIDLSNWKFRDDDDTHTFNIPQNTVLNANERFVLAADTILFQNRFPSVANFAGPIGFGLSSAGEAIRLFDSSGKLYQSMVYDEAAPWPQGANGNGFTLELVDTAANFCIGTNWMDGCPEGSPGTEYIFPCGPTALETLYGIEHFSVYPNPNGGKFNLAFASSSSELKFVEVYNLLGETVFFKMLNANNLLTEIDLSSAPKGIYFVKVAFKDGMDVKKVVIE